MSERTPWWKSFLVKRKANGAKDVDPDFDPFATKPERAKDPAAGAGPKGPAGKPESSREALGDDTYDDSHLESVFNEQTCRRNMRVSRSGRFKEKRKVRSSLPIEEQEAKSAPRKEEQR